MLEPSVRESRETGSPERYRGIDSDALAHAIERRRRELGDALLVLAHHYQRDEIVRHADFIGDSLRLSMRAAAASRERSVKWIVFCGVNFMAETADLLTDEHITVILPNRAARCPMAAMAEEDDVRDALRLLTSERLSARIRPLVPIAYVNSSAAVKAIVGESGGVCCTSANAQHALRWALDGGERPGTPARVLFLPDEHLGRNVCAALGIPDAQQALWDPGKEHAGPAPLRIRAARVIHWKGHCYVHTRFTRRDVERIRCAAACDGPPPRVIVHPECTSAVVAAADGAVSTEGMVGVVEAAAPGSRFFLGTEAHLVSRVARAAAQRDVEVRILGRAGAAAPMCGAMLQISPQDLLWSLDNLAEGRIVNAACVPADIRAGARSALERMLRLRA